MMKIIMLLVLLLIHFTVLTAQQTINQTDSNHLKQGKWIGKYPDGILRYEGYFKNDKPIGEWKRFHQNGELKAKLVYSPNSNKIIAELYDTEGILVSRGNYFGTEKDSIWTYYDNNVIVARENYLKGLKNGFSYSYLPDGSVISKSNWLNGKLNGELREYYSSGNKKSEISYLDGKRHGDIRIYFESGKVQIEGKFDQDKYTDDWSFYNEDGTLKFKLKYKDGILLNSGTVDSLQLKEFKAFDRDKRSLKDPEHYIENPEEYPMR